MVADLAHVAWAVNLGTLGFHVWPYLAHDPEHTDELRLDLDPQPGTDFAHIRAAAAEVRTLLDELGMTGYPKTTGNRGLHVYLRLQPRWDSYQVRAAAVAVARELERRRPDLLTAAWWKERRVWRATSLLVSATGERRLAGRPANVCGHPLATLRPPQTQSGVIKPGEREWSPH